VRALGRRQTPTTLAPQEESGGEVVSVSKSNRREDKFTGPNAATANPYPGRFETAADGLEPHQDIEVLGPHPASEFEHFVDKNAPETMLMIQPRQPTDHELVHQYYEMSIKDTINLGGMQ
jgi:hypothetical protein